MTSSNVIHSDPTIAHELSLAGIRVLVVDDDCDALAAIACVLAEAGAEVDIAHGVEDALSLLKARPDVVVSDIGMPGCDGLQLMRMVRARMAGSGGSTPAIALTGQTAAIDQTRALLAGYQLHLSKPVRASQLIDAIRDLVPSSRRPPATPDRRT